VLVLVPVLAAPEARADTPRATDLAAFQQDLDKVFSSDGLTADEAARRAAKAAPVMARKRATVEAASAEVSRSKLTLVPVLAGKATYTRLSPLDPVVLPLGGQMFVIPFLENSYSVGAQVAVNVSDYLSRDASVIDGASQALAAAKLDKQAASAVVGQQAREIYYEWLRAKLQVLVAKRQLAQVESTLAQVKTLVDVQRASTADKLRVESLRAQAQQAIDKLSSAGELREEQLRLLIGIASDEAIAVGEDVREDVELPEIGELDELATQATGRRAEVKAVDAGIHAKEALRRADASTLLPRLSAFASVDYADPNLRIFPQRDEFRLTWAVGVQLNWVINESLAAGDTRRRIAAETDELRADRLNLQHRVRLEVLGALQAVKLARRAIKTSQQGVNAAEEGYRVRKDLFGAGRASVVEMVDVEAELSRARIAALDARIDLRIALAKLAFAVGEPAR
jgi:outer membrane protein TolC